MAVRGLQQQQRRPSDSRVDRVAHAWPTATLALAMVVAAGCDFPGRPDPANRPMPESQVLDFALLYQRNCAGCHGKDGQLGPAPPLDDPIFVAIVPDDELLRVITEGRAGTPMPPFARRHGGPLSEEQVRSLARGIKQKWRAAEPKVDLPPYMLAKDDDNASARATRIERGLAVYARACAGCHGAGGEGTEDGARPVESMIARS